MSHQAAGSHTVEGTGHGRRSENVTGARAERKPLRRGKLAWLGLLVLAGSWVLPTLAAAETLTPRETRRLVKQAEKSLAENDLAGALEVYRRLASDSAPSAPERVDALWKLATGTLASDPEAAKGWLETLVREAPDSVWRGAAEALLALYATLDSTREESAALRGRLEEREAEIAAASDQLAGSDEAKTSLEQSVAGLRRELSDARDRLATLEEELEKKDEALQKLKDALVGGGGR